MKFEISTLMLIFFILFFIISFWKIYAFLPNKELADDDKTEASQKELLQLTIKIIKKHKGNLTQKELFMQIKEDKYFDEKHFWRFNQNRLNQLLNQYYLEHEGTCSIKDIYESI